MIERAELAAWLRLLATPTIGRSTARELLAAFGSPQAVFDASPRARREVLAPSQAAALDQPPSDWPALVEATWQWLQTEPDRHHVVVLGDARYPGRLLETADPPLLLHARGRIDLLAAAAVAVVGSRNPTPQGSENARAFANAFSRAGLTVVSGLALGIDGAAHEGALDGPGSTIAVVGTGLDRVYPKRHLALAHRIASEGLIVSEYPLGTAPLAAHFPQRNRLIAGLSAGTLVVEAAVRSGSLITAQLALEAGRDVFAIPGSIHAPQAKGCHALIKQGAKLTESAQDVLEELQVRPAARSAPASESGTESDPVLIALGHDPITLDALGMRLGWPPEELSARLLDLELDGRIARLAGQRFQRLFRG